SRTGGPPREAAGRRRLSLDVGVARLVAARLHHPAAPAEAPALAAVPAEREDVLVLPGHGDRGPHVVGPHLAVPGGLGAGEGLVHRLVRRDRVHGHVAPGGPQTDVAVLPRVRAGLHVAPSLELLAL